MLSRLYGHFQALYSNIVEAIQPCCRACCKSKDLKQQRNKDSPPFNMNIDCDDSEINENQCSKVIESIKSIFTEVKTKTV